MLDLTHRVKFSPDFFIKAGHLILVIEIKENEEVSDPAEENRKKNEYAITHFKRVNKYLKQAGSEVLYKFNFLTPSDFGKYFQSLRDGNIADYKSSLDVELLKGSRNDWGNGRIG